jgi:hypothetical protein
MGNLYIALVHYPVLNKRGETILTSVTNLDIHDIARCAMSFGVSRYFIVTPDPAQQEIVCKVTRFWQTESGLSYNPDRSQALSLIQISNNIESSIDWITMQEEMQPITVSTTARCMDTRISFEMMSNLRNEPRPVLLMFGTGYGLSDSIHKAADYILEPIAGSADYNHLPVRSAVAIILDRIASAVYKGRN